MAFNINEFKTEINRRKIVPENAYDFIVQTPQFVGIPDSGNLIKLRTENVTLPGLGFLQVDNHRPYGFGPSYNIPYGINITDISCTHVLDGQANVHRLFENWASNIIYWQHKRSLGGTPGKFSLNRDSLYSVNYLKDYAVDIKIITYNDDSRVAGIYILREAFPISIDQIPMAWDSTNSYTRVNVSWKFTDWQLETI